VNLIGGEATTQQKRIREKRRLAREEAGGSRVMGWRGGSFCCGTDLNSGSCLTLIAVSIGYIVAVTGIRRVSDAAGMDGTAHNSRTESDFLDVAWWAACVDPEARPNPGRSPLAGIPGHRCQKRSF